MAADLITSTLLVNVLAKSVPAIKEVIAQSLHVKKKEIEGDADQLANAVRNKITEKAQAGEFAGSLDVAADALLDSWIVETRKALASQRKESLSEAHISFIVALVALIIGILLVFVGVVLGFTVDLKVGIVTSACSIVFGIVCGLAFKFNQQAHDRLDENAKGMNRLDSAYVASNLASQIADQDKRDKAIEELVKRVWLYSVA